MFCLLVPTLWKQQQIAVLIISLFLYANGIRNEGSNMLQRQQQQTLEQQQHSQQEQQHEEQQHHEQTLQPLHATIKNSNYQSPSSSSKSIFKPSPLVEFTLADATLPQSYVPTYDAAKYTSHQPLASPQDASTDIEQSGSEMVTTKTKGQYDNRRYSTTTNGGTQFLFPNEQQQVYPIPQLQQAQHNEHQQLSQSQQPYQQQQQFHLEQQFTEMPIYTYRDPYTNENYHYKPTEPTNFKAEQQSLPASYTSNSHNDNGLNGYRPQQQLDQLHQPATQAQDNQEYLVHSSMSVGGAQRPSQQPNPYFGSSDKDIYLKRPGLVYDESYVAHPNAVVEKKRDTPQTTKINKISYDSHDYPPPSYAQQQTSNFLPTPVPERPATPRPTQPPPIRRPPSFAHTHDQEYRPRPPISPISSPPTTRPFTFGRPPPLTQQQQQQQQQYLQSSQNALPNYANNLDNYLSNQQPGPYYQNERPRPRPTPSYAQQPQQQYPYYENSPPSYRPPATPPQQLQQSSYPAYESPQYHHQQSMQYPSRPSYNNYYGYQIGEVPPQAQGAFNYPYPRPPNGPHRPPAPAAVQQPSGWASLVQYAPQFTSLLLGGAGGGAGGGGGGSSSNSALGSLFGALTGIGNVGQQSSSSSSSAYNRRPINAQLIRALENIARNDDLQCVPKVVCQMIAGQIQRGQLPGFATSPAITNFLAGFPAASPALIYGRAALLGISGGDKSCHQTYVKCPKNEVEIIYYLNNHRGGFFKFFSEPEPQPTYTHQQSQDSPQASLFSILAALTGNEQQQAAAPPSTPRPPRPKPQPSPSSDITSTIGNFFSNLLSDYMGEGATVEYQRRRRKRSAERRVRFLNEEDEHYDFDPYVKDYNDDEDADDTQGVIDLTKHPEYLNDQDVHETKTQSRITQNNFQTESRSNFFPVRPELVPEDNGKTEDEDVVSLIQRFNDMNRQRKFKFPADITDRQYAAAGVVKGSRELQEEPTENNYSRQYTNYETETDQHINDPNMVSFHRGTSLQASYHHPYIVEEPKDVKASRTQTEMVFPEREGRILNPRPFVASYTYNHHEQQSPREEREGRILNPSPVVASYTIDHHEQQSPREEREGRILNPRPFLASYTHDHHELQSPHEEPEHQLLPPHIQRLQAHSELYAPQANYLQGPANNNQINSAVSIANQGPQDNSPTGSYVFNNHMTSSNSLNSFVSNSATNLNNYYGAELGQAEFKPMMTPSTNYFLPTPAPAIDANTNSLQPNNQFLGHTNTINQLSTNTAINSQQHATTNNNNYNIYKTPSSSSGGFSPGSTTYFASSFYNSYKPISKPSSSGFSHSSNYAHYSGGSYNSDRTQSYPVSGAINSNYNSQGHPSSTSYSQNNNLGSSAHHSSGIYTSDRPQMYPVSEINSNYNSQRYPSSALYTENNNLGSSAHLSSGIYSSARPPHTYPASEINTNHNSQGYPSSTAYTQNNNRYHSSFYTTRRPVVITTKRSDDLNIYVTNGFGETEYYVTPDGRKIYL